MAKPTRYIVDGANFVATLVIDEELFPNNGTEAGNAYLEAATRTIENIYRHGPDDVEEFDLLLKRDDSPTVGVLMSICKDGEIGEDNKLHFIKTAIAAQNAGVLELVRHFEEHGWAT